MQIITPILIASIGINIAYLRAPDSLIKVFQYDYNLEGRVKRLIALFEAEFKSAEKLIRASDKIKEEAKDEVVTIFRQWYLDNHAKLNNSYQRFESNSIFLCNAFGQVYFFALMSALTLIFIHSFSVELDAQHVTGKHYLTALAIYCAISILVYLAIFIWVQVKLYNAKDEQTKREIIENRKFHIPSIIIILCSIICLSGFIVFCYWNIMCHCPYIMGYTMLPGIITGLVPLIPVIVAYFYIQYSLVRASIGITYYRWSGKSDYDKLVKLILNK